MKESKSISFKVITLVKIFALIMISIIVLTNIPKKLKTAKLDVKQEVEVATACEEFPSNEIVETREITVSSRSEERQIDEKQITSAEEMIEITEEKNYIEIEDVTISKNMDLTVRTGLSKEDFIKLISGVKQDTSGFFEQNAGLIYDICQEYELNEIFFCGLISAESGWQIANNHRKTYNYISLMSNGKLIQFASVEDGLTKAAQKLHNNYLTPGGKFYYGKTLSAVKTKFCPASSTWVNLVYGRMSQIVNQ